MRKKWSIGQILTTYSSCKPDSTCTGSVYMKHNLLFNISNLIIFYLHNLHV